MPGDQVPNFRTGIPQILGVAFLNGRLPFYTCIMRNEFTALFERDGGFLSSSAHTRAAWRTTLTPLTRSAPTSED
jgi:hypothetical protein